MVGRLTASQIASASPASVLPRFTYGVIVGRRHQPNLMAEPDQLAPPVVARAASLHADQTRAASLLKNGSICARLNARRTTTSPAPLIA